MNSLLKKAKSILNKKYKFRFLKNGFTLVELLAVIVILAIIMIIAIPAVLNTMQTARKKTFIEYAQKVYMTVERRYLEDISFNNLPNISIGHYVYSIKDDLGLSSTGDIDGFVVLWKENDNTEFHLIMYDDNFYLFKSNAQKEEITESDLTNLNEAVANFNPYINSLGMSQLHSFKDIDKNFLIMMIKTLMNADPQGDANPAFSSISGGCYHNTNSINSVIVDAGNPSNIIKTCE